MVLLKTVKERTRALCNLVPYTKYTVLMTRTVVEMATKMIKAFPSKNGISKKSSPATIVEGKKKLNLGVKKSLLERMLWCVPVQVIK